MYNDYAITTVLFCILIYEALLRKWLNLFSHQYTCTYTHKEYCCWGGIIKEIFTFLAAYASIHVSCTFSSCVFYIAINFIQWTFYLLKNIIIPVKCQQDIKFNLYFSCKQLGLIGQFNFIYFIHLRFPLGVTFSVNERA